MCIRYCWLFDVIVDVSMNVVKTIFQAIPQITIGANFTIPKWVVYSCCNHIASIH